MGVAADGDAAGSEAGGAAADDAMEAEGVVGVIEDGGVVGAGGVAALGGVASFVGVVKLGGVACGGGRSVAEARGVACVKGVENGVCLRVGGGATLLHIWGVELEEATPIGPPIARASGPEWPPFCV